MLVHAGRYATPILAVKWKLLKLPFSEPKSRITLSSHSKIARSTNLHAFGTSGRLRAFGVPGLHSPLSYAPTQAFGRGGSERIESVPVWAIVTAIAAFLKKRQETRLGL